MTLFLFLLIIIICKRKQVIKVSESKETYNIIVTFLFLKISVVEMRSNEKIPKIQSFINFSVIFALRSNEKKERKKDQM